MSRQVLGYSHKRKVVSEGVLRNIISLLHLFIVVSHKFNEKQHKLSSSILKRCIINYLIFTGIWKFSFHVFIIKDILSLCLSNSLQKSKFNKTKKLKFSSKEIYLYIYNSYQQLKCQLLITKIMKQFCQVSRGKKVVFKFFFKRVIISVSNLIISRIIYHYISQFLFYICSFKYIAIKYLPFH
ncbi:hypothetical protein ABPG74_008577 [Tetrahymena malaccensis]